MYPKLSSCLGFYNNISGDQFMVGLVLEYMLFVAQQIGRVWKILRYDTIA